MTLKEYKRKRRAGATPEPMDDLEGDASGAEPTEGGLRFVVQMHSATRLHFDFRLEMGGAYKSWAVPKGPTLNPTEQRLSVFVEDHPLAYGTFEGVIPKGNYGAGTVMIWDAGTYVERSSSGRRDSEKAMLKGLDAGHMTFVVSGHKLAGEFALIRLEKDKTGKSWLLVKKRDEYARHDDFKGAPVSVATGRTLAEITAEAPAKKEVWLPGKGPEDAAALHGDKTFAPPPPKPAKAKRRTRTLAAPLVSSEEPATEALPRRLPLMLPTIRTDDDDSLAGQGQWLFAPRLDGQRAVAVIEPKRATLSSRQNLSFNAKHPSLVQALAKLGTRAVLDGELVKSDGRSLYYVFDLLHLDGLNLRDLPLARRLERLASLTGLVGDEVKLLPWSSDRSTAERASAALGAHGLMARHGESPFVPGTSDYWVKLPSADASATEPTVEDVPVTHRDRVYWPKEGRTKGQLIDYYKQVAEVMLPHLLGRPHSLHRHPEGIDAEGFYQKDLSGYVPTWVATTRIYSESTKRSIDYLVCQNAATLIYMANLGCIEINPWLSRIVDLDRPDHAVIDIDPDKQGYDDVVAVALAFRAELDRLELRSFVKTSGATGMHIFLPLAGEPTFADARLLTESVARRVEAKLPQLTTLERNPDKRRGRIYLDCGQNRRGQTLAAPYSVRPRPGAPVSTPLAWDEVRKGLSPHTFTVETTPARLAKVGALWAKMAQEANDCARVLELLRAAGEPLGD